MARFGRAKRESYAVSQLISYKTNTAGSGLSDKWTWASVKKTHKLELKQKVACWWKTPLCLLHSHVLLFSLLWCPFKALRVHLGLFLSLWKAHCISGPESTIQQPLSQALKWSFITLFKKKNHLSGTSTVLITNCQSRKACCLELLTLVWISALPLTCNVTLSTSLRGHFVILQAGVYNLLAAHLAKLGA